MKAVKAVIGQYHDFLAMNLKEIVFNPTPEDCERILRESVVEPGELMNCPKCGEPLTRQQIASVMRSIPSEKRSEASRENGKKGGRPRTKKVLDNS